MNYLTEENINFFINSALKEDVGSGDYSSLASIPNNAISRAQLIVKDNGILAGVELAKLILNQVDSQLILNFFKKDGDLVQKGDIAFTVEGKAQSILTAERLVLNCMQRMSGIATYTHQLSSLIAHTNAKLLDTRKTTPNARIIEKWAVKIGGGENHRYALYDMIMLKDNHIDYAGGIPLALEKTKKYLKDNNLNLKIIVEVRDLEELKQCVNDKDIYRVLLDNMSPEDMKKAIQIIKGVFKTEASGGINEKSIVEVAESGVDYISVGALTHSYTSLDLSLKAY